MPNPVLLAAGIAGYGDATAPGLDLAQLGGYVTAPVTRRPWRGEPPQLVETPGGLLWRRSLWNPGAGRVLRDYASLWRHSPVPVIVHVAGREPDELAAVATMFEELPGVAGLELDVAATGLGEDQAGVLARACERVWAVRDAADLPLLVRLPLLAGDRLAQAVIEAGASALVVAQPPAGLHIDLARGGLRQEGQWHGPGLLNLVASQVAGLASWVKVPLVTCGGVHSVQDALGLLAAGAAAVEIGTAAWVDGALPARVAAALSPE